MFLNATAWGENKVSHLIWVTPSFSTSVQIMIRWRLEWWCIFRAIKTQCLVHAVISFSEKWRNPLSLLVKTSGFRVTPDWDVRYPFWGGGGKTRCWKIHRMTEGGADSSRSWEISQFRAYFQGVAVRFQDGSQRASVPGWQSGVCIVPSDHG